MRLIHFQSVFKVPPEACVADKSADGKLHVPDCRNVLIPIVLMTSYVIGVRAP